ncbi:ribonuclease HII [Staphylococcus coagulans]|uniref:ribonuclease HII n=1 Tax=Staphylococcus coagulans TaxID=74706 RepID=UPI0030ECE5F3
MKQSKTIAQIKKEIQAIQNIQSLKAHPDYHDTRKGVQRIFLSREKQIGKIQAQLLKYEEMCQFENEILAHHPEALICGIDEVGRGPLAGPVVASAVVLQPEHHFIGINDSKQLSSAKRKNLNTQLQANVRAWQIGVVTPQEIDELNIYEATKLAMYRAIEKLTVVPTHYLIDAMTLDKIAAPQQSIIKGDARSVSIAAAGIIAKEYRDDLMASYDQQYPGYDFSNNAGYGTKKHLDGLEAYGVTDIHRKSFEPIKSIIAKKL